MNNNITKDKFFGFDRREEECRALDASAQRWAEMLEEELVLLDYRLGYASHKMASACRDLDIIRGGSYNIRSGNAWGIISTNEMSVSERQCEYRRLEESAAMQRMDPGRRASDQKVSWQQEMNRIRALRAVIKQEIADAQWQPA